MAIIPQYSAGAPAGPAQPAMEPGSSGLRLDASGQLAALGDIAGQIAQGTRPLANFDADFGQAPWRGVQDIGRGAQALGEHVRYLQDKVQKARDYVEVTAMQSELDAEMHRFDEWKARNPDPSAWGPNFQERISAFPEKYMENRDLSPEAREAAMARFSAFATVQSASVAREAAVATVGLARESGKADWLRAVEAGNPEMAASISRGMYQEGWIGADEAARMEIQAANRIESDVNKQSENQIKAFLLQRNVEGVLRVIDQNPYWTEDEKHVRNLEAREIHAVNIRADDLKNSIYDDPGAVISHLEQKDSSGAWVNDSAISGRMRDDLLKAAHKERNDRQNAAFSGFSEDLDRGNSGQDFSNRVNVAVIEGVISKEDRAVLFAMRDGTLPSDPAEITKLHNEIVNLDLEKDRFGTAAAQLERRIRAVQNREDQAKLIGEYEFRTNGGQFSIPEKARSMALDNYVKDAEATGTWKVPATSIEAFEMDGKKVFVNLDEVPSADDEDYFEKKKRFPFPGMRRGRVVELSQEDQLKVEKGENVLVQDLKRKREQLSVIERDMEALESSREAGKFNKVGDLQESINAVLRNPRKRTWEKAVSLEDDSAGFEALRIDGGQGSVMPSGLQSGPDPSLFPALERFADEYGKPKTTEEEE